MAQFGSVEYVPDLREHPHELQELQYLGEDIKPNPKVENARRFSLELESPILLGGNPVRVEELAGVATAQERLGLLHHAIDVWDYPLVSLTTLTLSNLADNLPGIKRSLGFFDSSIDQQAFYTTLSASGQNSLKTRLLQRGSVVRGEDKLQFLAERDKEDSPYQVNTHNPHMLHPTYNGDILLTTAVALTLQEQVPEISALSCDYNRTHTYNGVTLSTSSLRWRILAEFTANQETETFTKDLTDKIFGQGHYKENIKTFMNRALQNLEAQGLIEFKNYPQIYQVNSLTPPNTGTKYYEIFQRLSHRKSFTLQDVYGLFDQQGDLDQRNLAGFIERMCVEGYFTKTREVNTSGPKKYRKISQRGQELIDAINEALANPIEYLRRHYQEEVTLNSFKRAQSQYQRPLYLNEMPASYQTLLKGSIRRYAGQEP